jgi:hypothetical protein
LPSSTKNVSASKPSAAPVSAVTSTSTSSASIAPFAPPIASIEPANAALASVVGRPSWSSAQPSGIGCPALAATITLPRATSDKERSIVSGGPSRRGSAAAIGLVPNSGRFPPGAGIADGELPNARPTMPAAAMGPRCQAATPK